MGATTTSGSAAAADPFGHGKRRSRHARDVSGGGGGIERTSGAGALKLIDVGADTIVAQTPESVMNPDDDAAMDDLEEFDLEEINGPDEVEEVQTVLRSLQE